MLDRATRRHGKNVMKFEALVVETNTPRSRKPRDRGHPRLLLRPNRGHRRRPLVIESEPGHGCYTPRGDLGHPPMSKVRFAVLLPVLMICAALAVERWQGHVRDSVPPKGEYPFVSTATLVYQGINAPALLFSKLSIEFLPIYHITRTPSSFLGVGVERMLFFLGVAILWLLLGMWLDRRRQTKATSQRMATPTTVLIGLVEGAVGITLVYVGLYPFRNPGSSTNPFGDVAKGVLVIVWGISLMVLCGSAVFRRVRSGSGSRQGHGTEGS
jgi:hypothetical protein